MNMSKVLLIEDDENLIKYIKEYLTAYEYFVDIVEDFNTVVEKVQQVNPDVIILDINLPKFDGFYFLKVIRRKFSVPIIILSARNGEAEQIRGMELGADDYVTKPFSIGILLAKINAILRRMNGVYENNDISLGDLILISDSMKLKYGEAIIELSKNEYKMLSIFMKKSEQVVLREELLEALWDDTIFVDDNTLTVNITRLKRKLDNLGLKDVIITKRGVGYVFSKANI